MSNFFQWPKIIPYNFKKTNKKYSNKSVDEIERFFSKNYKSKYSILTPSGRSALNLILSFNNFDRSKIVNIPKWSSSCLFQTIGAITNVSIGNYSSDCQVVVHKWGHTFKLTKRRNYSQLVIDDSADTIPNANYVPFINQSDYEFISIPKIIGSFSGGIIITKDKKFYEFCKKKQTENKNLAIYQSQKKYESIFSKSKYSDWMYLESFNTSLEYNMIENIKENLKNYEKNKNIILSRRNYIKDKFKNVYLDKDRLGPCLVIKKKRKNKSLNVRHFNFLRRADKENYLKSYVLPIHFGIKNQDFKKMTRKLSKLNK